VWRRIWLRLSWRVFFAGVVDSARRVESNRAVVPVLLAAAAVGTASWYGYAVEYFTAVATSGMIVGGFAALVYAVVAVDRGASW
jgi:hypothetical protein